MKIPSCLLLVTTLALSGQSTRGQELPCPVDPFTAHPIHVEPDFPPLPKSLSNRFSEKLRLAAITQHGGDERSEDSVQKALRYLKKTQNPDGSWSERFRVGMTSLALLCYLGHGATAQSEEFGETVLYAMTYLIDKTMKNNGKLASDFKDNHWPYEHALATYALAESYTLCVKVMGEIINQSKEALMLAGQFLINSQHMGGGWDYAYSEDSSRGGDSSITSWHLQALSACKFTGLDFKNHTKSYKKGLDYLTRLQMPDGAIGYSGPLRHGRQDGTTLAAAGARCFQLFFRQDSEVVKKAVGFIDKEMKFNWETPDSDLYGHFFASQLMFEHGGKEWARYHKKVFPGVLTHQAKDGSFLPVNRGNQETIKAVCGHFALPNEFGTHYRTCLATLILQTYYRCTPSRKDPE